MQVILLVLVSALGAFSTARAGGLPLAAGTATTAPDARPPVLHVQHLTAADGLAQTHVSAIAQDAYGFMWFATADGLYRYDGYELLTFRHAPADSTSLPDNAISSLVTAPDDPNVLWLGTATGGLITMDLITRRFTRVDHRHAGPYHHSGNQVLALSVTPTTIWMGTGAGLHHIDRQTGRCIEYRHDAADAEGLTDDRVNALRMDANGHLWVATGNGLTRVDLHTGEMTRFFYVPAEDASPERFFTAVIVDRRVPGRLWIGTGDGLLRFDAAAGTVRRYLQDSVVPNEITGIAEDLEEDVLWVSSRRGLYRFDRRTEEATRYEQDARNTRGFSGNDLLYVYTDRTGIVWVSVKNNGVDRFDPTGDFRHIPSQADHGEGLSGQAVFSIYKDRQKRLWVGTSTGGLDLLDASGRRIANWRHRPDDPRSLSSNNARKIYEDLTGTLWIGTDRGLNRMDAPGRFTRFRNDPADPASLSNNYIRDIYESPREPGVLWIATAGGGLNRFDRQTGRFRAYRAAPGDSTALPQDWLWDLLEDAGGALWIGLSIDGLCRMDRQAERFTCFIHDPHDPASIGRGRVITVYERAREPGILWLGTYGGGLNRFDTSTGRFKRYTEADGLPNDVVYAIVEDEEGGLWLSTNKGLSRFDPAAGTFRNYGLGSGISALEYNAGAAFQDAGDGEIFFGSVNGVTAFHPYQVRPNPYEPQVALKNLWVTSEARGHPVMSDAMREGHVTRTFAYYQSTITFDFVALHYKNPVANRYAYRLEGVDPGWIEARNMRPVTYTHLTAGTYALLVRAANSDGIWSDDTRLLQFTIGSPPWQTWWAYGLYGLALIGVVLGFVRWRTTRILRVQKQIGQLLALRTQDLVTKNRDLEEALAEAEAARAVIAAQAAQLRELDELKSQFFANVSHEFRTPLTLLLGPLRAMLDGRYGPLTPGLREHLELMHRNGHQVLRLIEEILELARLDAHAIRIDRRPADIAAFVAHHAEQFRPLAEVREIHYRFASRCTACVVAFDATYLGRVLNNLLSNAFKYTPGGGRITVTLSASDGEAVLEVADTGAGIAEEDLPHIFDRFYRSLRSDVHGKIGSGIGLAITRRLVELHEGTIEVVSKPEEGSRFIVRLPLTDAPVEAASDRRAELRAVQAIDAGLPDASPAGGDEAAAASRAEEPLPLADQTTILVVEDHPEVRAFLRVVLAPGFRVIEAGNGVEGLERARALLPDLIVSDVMMPEMDGFSLVRALRSDPATDCIPIILLTARAGVEDHVAGLQTLADAFLTKPFSGEVLRAEVHNLIALRQHLRERYRAAPPTSEEQEADDTLAAQVRRVVEQHLSNPDLSVGDVADAVALSTSQLNRRLKDEAGYTVSAFVRRVRLEHAAVLLAGGKGTVSEVAYAVGFNSLSYFSQRFREELGVSPSEYGARERNGR